MSLRYMAFIVSSEGLRTRLRLCAAHAGVQVEPEWWVATHIDRIAVRDGWAEAWRAAWDAGHDTRPDYDPGLDEAAITDEMIAAAVADLMETDAAAESAAAAKALADAEARLKETAKADAKMRADALADEQTRLRMHQAIAAEQAPLPPDPERTTK